MVVGVLGVLGLLVQSHVEQEQELEKDPVMILYHHVEAVNVLASALTIKVVRGYQVVQVNKILRSMRDLT